MSVKLTIKAYSDNSFSSEKGEFVSTINPSNLKIISDLIYGDNQLFHNNNWLLKYKKSQPRRLSFSLIFDSTGIFPDSKISVKDQIKSFLSIIESYQKDIKEPFYLRVIWGTVDFTGKLESLNIDYSLFNIDGVPIRAEAKLCIIEQKPKTDNPTSQKEDKTQKNDTSEQNNNDNNKNNNNNKDKMNDDKAENTSFSRGRIEGS